MVPVRDLYGWICYLGVISREVLNRLLLGIRLLALPDTQRYLYPCWIEIIYRQGVTRGSTVLIRKILR